MASFRAVIEGLQILAKHDPEGIDSHNIDAHDDIIYAGVMMSSPDKLPPADRGALEKLGWHFDREANSWALSIWPATDGDRPAPPTPP